MTPGIYLTRLLGLPEIEILHFSGRVAGWHYVEAKSVSNGRACPKCAEFCDSVYDHRYVSILDAPIRDSKVNLRIRKKRYFCRKCKKPFTELLHGIFSRARITERLKRYILWACNKFQNLVQVAKYYGCSAMTVRRGLYAHLEIDIKRRLNHPWPKRLGIDEHSFGKKKGKYGGTEFNTVFVDIKNHRLFRVGHTKNSRLLYEQFKDIEGGEFVEDVAIDLSEGYRSLVKALFPNARITADKFHVLRLLVPAINRRRKKLAGDRRKNPIGKLLLRSAKRLDYSQRFIIHTWLEAHKELKAIYQFKERMHGLYRIRGKNRAEIAYEIIINDLKNYAHIPELKTLHYTLCRWRNEILNYFQTNLTNAMTEGFNNKAKLLKKMGYGYKNQYNFGLRLLNACFH